MQCKYGECQLKYLSMSTSRACLFCVADTCIIANVILNTCVVGEEKIDDQQCPTHIDFELSSLIESTGDRLD